MVTLQAAGWHSDWHGNSVLAWVCAAGGAVVGYLIVMAVLRVLRSHVDEVLRRRLSLPGRRRPTTGLRSVRAVLRAIRSWLLVPLAALIALDVLHFGDRAEYWLRVATFLVVGVQVVLCLNRVIVTWLRRSIDEGERPGDAPVMLAIVTWTAQFLVWVTFLLVWLANAGVDITAFVASLGIGGIAIALALQNVLGDLFASVAIGLDKPFEVGEFIEFGDDLGTVTRVGIKTTRIESLSGEELAIANSKLLEQLVHNYDRRTERRVLFGFRVPYDTTRAQLREITDRINQVISDTDLARLDRGNFLAFSEWGFEFEFVYYVLDPTYNVYTEVQQQINEQIVDLLAELRVPFAVPGGKFGGVADAAGTS